MKLRHLRFVSSKTELTQSPNNYLLANVVESSTTGARLIRAVQVSTLKLGFAFVAR